MDEIFLPGFIWNNDIKNLEIFACGKIYTLLLLVEYLGYVLFKRGLWLDGSIALAGEEDIYREYPFGVIEIRGENRLRRHLATLRNRSRMRCNQVYIWTFGDTATSGYGNIDYSLYRPEVVYALPKDEGDEGYRKSDLANVAFIKRWTGKYVLFRNIHPNFPKYLEDDHGGKADETLAVFGFEHTTRDGQRCHCWSKAQYATQEEKSKWTTDPERQARHMRGFTAEAFDRYDKIDLGKYIKESILLNMDMLVTLPAFALYLIKKEEETVEQLESRLGTPAKSEGVDEPSSSGSTTSTTDVDIPSKGATNADD